MEEDEFKRIAAFVARYVVHKKGVNLKWSTPAEQNETRRKVGNFAAAMRSALNLSEEELSVDNLLQFFEVTLPH